LHHTTHHPSTERTSGGLFTAAGTVMGQNILPLCKRDRNEIGTEFLSAQFGFLGLTLASASAKLVARMQARKLARH
jgi:hypothetical protein